VVPADGGHGVQVETADAALGHERVERAGDVEIQHVGES
jgi:hypothetical protein